jgi:hypothetical protein
MTSKENAELLFKQEQLSGGRSSIREYEQRAHAEHTKTAQNTQRPPGFECYDSRVRQIRSPSWKKRRRDGETDTAQIPQIPRMMPLISTRNLSVDVRRLRHCRTEILPFEGWSPAAQ